MECPDSPRFSIIVCCWNSASHIGECIASIRRQQRSDLEVLFVDGGSTDTTLDLIAASGLPHRVLHDIRGGIARAMNIGILEARGEIVAHLHADDYYLDGEVLNTVDAALRAHPHSLWLYGRFLNDIDGRLLPPGYPFHPYSRAELLRRNLVPHVSTFIRRSAFADCGLFDMRYRLAMDYDLWLRLSRHGDALQIDRPLGAFRRHSQSSTSKHRLASFNEDFLARFRHAPVALWPEFVLRYFSRRLTLARIQRRECVEHNRSASPKAVERHTA